MTNLIEDISKLTTIPIQVLDKLLTKSHYCISDAVADSLLADKRLTEIDIGIGMLYIELKNDVARYKFIPSKELEKNVKNTLINGENLLRDKLEQVLVTRITDTYKELL